jgi:ornithine cyclodeaminase
MSEAPVTLSADQVSNALPFPDLIHALRHGFARPATVPNRTHHAIAQAAGPDATLLMMPAWLDEFLGVKIVTVHPSNAALGLPAVHGTYLLSRADSGESLAVLDGSALTARRTAAVAALAADYLARRDASRLLLVGSGTLAALLPDAFRAVRPIETVEVWNVRPAGGEALAGRLRAAGFDARAATDLDEAVERADIVCCATLSRAALVRGERLRPGTHLDLIGSFTPDMRECDDAAMTGARVFVDTRAAIEEAGDLVQPLASGALDRGRIEGVLADLVAARIPGRRDEQERTVFKSVGTALADLLAAVHAWRIAAAPGETKHG